MQLEENPEELNQGKSQRLFPAKVIVLISLIGSAMFFAFNERPIGSKNPAPVAISSNCDISKSKCEFVIPKVGSGIVEIRPLPLKSEKRFSVLVSDLTFQPRKIEMDLERIDSPMGYNKPQLTPSADGYSVETVFPTCTVDRMPWKMTLLISTSDGLYAVSWNVEVSRN